MYEIPATALALIGLSAIVRNWSACFVAGILLANWSACALLSYSLGDVSNWVALAGIDYASGVIIGVFADRRWSLLVVALYVLMLIAHVAFSIHDTLHLGMTARQYFDGLTVLAWLQMLAVLGWVCVDLYKARRRRRNPEGSAFAATSLLGKDGGAP